MNLYSVIIPVYNTPKKLFESCIQSVITQDYNNLEIIIVNDGSNEETSNLCKEISKKDNRIKLLEQENSGVSKARNKGILSSTGNYITFLDSDDTFSQKFFSTVENNIEDYDILVYGMRLVYPNKSITGNNPQRKISDKDRMEIISGILMHNSEIGKIIGIDHTAGKIYKRSFLINNNIQFNYKLCRHEDSIFCLNAFQKMDNGIIIPFVGYNYIFNYQSVCQKFDKKVFKDTELAVNEYSNFINKYYPTSDTMKNALNYKIVDMIMSDCTTRYFTNSSNPETQKQKKKEFKAFIDNNTIYKQAFLNLNAKFPFSFYSFAVKHNMTAFMFTVFSRINGLIRFFTIR